MTDDCVLINHQDSDRDNDGVMVMGKGQTANGKGQCSVEIC